MSEPDGVLSLWNDLIAQLPESDGQRARELMLRVQGRQRTETMPEPSLESSGEPVDTVAVDDATLSPEGRDLPDDLHDLLSMFH